MKKILYKKTLAADSLQNLIANIGTGTDRVSKSNFIANDFYSNDELGAIYMGWLGRRIVDLVPNEALKKGWQIVCPSWEPEKIETLNAYTTHILQLPKKLNEALKASRTFGGSILLAITDSRFGSFKNPIPNFLPKNSLLGIQMYDAWQCYPALLNFSNPLAKNYRNPEQYTIGASGMEIASYRKNKDGNIEQEFIQGTLVDWTRTQRFDGLTLPWYLRQRNLYWGQSVLSNAYEAVRNAKGVDASIASLLFRASVPVLKVQDLAGIVSDPEQRAAFLERINTMNYGMSNNNLAIIDASETLESFEPGAISNMDAILERYYILCSSAVGIPVTKLIGESAKGLNATGEGDLNNYYDMLEDYQNLECRPALLQMYKNWIVPSLFDELVPRDFQIVFPTLERVSPDKKQTQDKEFIDMITLCLENKLINTKIARREIVERQIFKNFSLEDAEQIEKENGDNELELQDALDAADGEEDRELIYELTKMIEEETDKEIVQNLVLLRSVLREKGIEQAKEYIQKNKTLRNYLGGA